MNDDLLVRVIFATPDEGVKTVILNHEFSFIRVIFDMATILDDDFLHLLNLCFVHFRKTVSPYRKRSSHKYVVFDLHRLPDLLDLSLL